MCEADLSSADQVVIFKGDCACLQAINLTAFTTGDLVFMGRTKFLPVGVSSQQNVVQWNSLLWEGFEMLMGDLEKTLCWITVREVLTLVL